MTRRAFASLALSAIILVTAAWAQDPSRPDQYNQPGMAQQQGQQMGQPGQQRGGMGQGGATAMMPPSAWLKAKDLVDRSVKDSSNTDLGKINDLIILPENGFIPFAIISGSKIDRSGEDIALPWSLLRFEPGAKDVTLTVTKDTLHDAKLAAFKNNQWPDFAQPTFVERVYREFGQTPPSIELTARTAGHAEGGAAEENGAGEHWFKLSTLRDEELKDSTGAKIGSAENVLIDLQNGHILFVTLSGRDVGRHNEYLAVPWGALKIEGSGTKTHLVLSMTKDDLKRAPAFKEDNWAEVTSPQFLQGVFSFYHLKPYWEQGRTREAGYQEPQQQPQQTPPEEP